MDTAIIVVSGYYPTSHPVGRAMSIGGRIAVSTEGI